MFTFNQNECSRSAGLRSQDKPRPRLYWYDPNRKVGEAEPDITDENNIEDIDTPTNITTAFSEQDLNPILIEYLKTELNLYCQRD